MRLGAAGVRAPRAAEPPEPEAESEEAPEPVHHEHHHPEHHPPHDYDHIKDKFMNELGHLPSTTLTNQHTHTRRRRSVTPDARGGGPPSPCSGFVFSECRSASLKNKSLQPVIRYNRLCQE